MQISQRYWLWKDHRGHLLSFAKPPVSMPETDEGMPRSTLYTFPDSSPPHFAEYIWFCAQCDVRRYAKYDKNSSSNSRHNVFCTETQINDKACMHILWKTDRHLHTTPFRTTRGRRCAPRRFFLLCSHWNSCEFMATRFSTKTNICKQEHERDVFFFAQTRLCSVER